MLTQLNVVVRDMDATVAFYRRLGLDIEAEPGGFHVTVKMPNGFLLEFDTIAFAHRWDTGFDGTTGGSTVLGFAVPARADVDARFDDLVEAGYRGRQPPYDAFWGARYAIVDDPDGNGVGIMSPIERERKFWPPSRPPSTSDRTEP